MEHSAFVSKLAERKIYETLRQVINMCYTKTRRNLNASYVAEAKIVEMWRIILQIKDVIRAEPQNRGTRLVAWTEVVDFVAFQGDEYRE